MLRVTAPVALPQLRPVRTVERSEFGATVERLRRLADFSQSELARRTGCDRAYIHRMEKSPVTAPVVPSRHLVRAMTVALKLTPADADGLLAAAGYAPQAILAAGGWRPELASLADFLGDASMSERDRLSFWKVMQELMIHWRGKAAVNSRVEKEA